jgi:hypothetical protein
MSAAKNLALVVNIVNVVEQLKRCRAGGRCKGIGPCGKK